ncbi:predicted protein [Chaetoceros tenuissimus]|uniref:Uncharacterized protein n=1 Tax=Chaetoceros tenuissimus TaxID=426638 RepID=A0AAD3CLN7_9STRA|nr:predicted protein [Chaetoceros tenuissimus]
MSILKIGIRSEGEYQSLHCCPLLSSNIKEKLIISKRGSKYKWSEILGGKIVGFLKFSSWISQELSVQFT